MSTASEFAAVADAQPARSSAPSPTRPFYWSVRRELWEHRSVYIAPLIVAGLVLLAFLVRLVHLPQTIQAFRKLPPFEQILTSIAPFGIATGAIVVTGVIVGFFYCLGALYGERRDRSILFWKSLPVSNTTTVLSKAVIPFIALPVVVFVVTIAAQLIMLLLGTAVLAANGMSAETLWTYWPIGKISLVLAYGLIALTLWYAPIVGWLLLVSSWARSMAILWAVLPPLGLCVIERVALDTSYLGNLVDYRLNGFLSEAFSFKALKGNVLVDPLTLLTPMKFLSAPGLWIGILFAVAFIAGAIWLRRNREPI